MIIFPSEGQLGNQLFQYAFLKTIQQKHEKIIVHSFDELSDLFSNITIDIKIPRKIWVVSVIFRRIIVPLLNFLGSRGVITVLSVDYETILETYKREAVSYTVRKGRISSIKYVKTGFFQSEHFFKPEVVQSLHLKPEYISEANLILQKLPLSAQPVFIHIRRNDYLGFEIYGQTAVLPVSYYTQCIEWFTNNYKNPYFIFFSDDMNFVEKEFSHIENKLFSTANSSGIDFALMTLCNGAVLSPSSFGWWGAYFMKDNKNVFAPKNWLGFASGVEYQRGAVAHFMREIII